MGRGESGGRHEKWKKVGEETASGFTTQFCLGLCNIVICKKYIIGHSDVFLVYIWSSSMLPGSQFSKPLEFLE